jgi:outer membrane scaffolding protein for murein synthesis (MipA/OmpV family)
MKILLTFLLFVSLLLGTSNTAFAQENYGGELNAFVRFGDNSSVGAHYEFQVVENITVSPEARISFSSDAFISLGGRADYYFDSLFNLDEPWDVWAGVDAGFIISGNDTFSVNIHTGGEYKFDDTWSIIAEIGAGQDFTGGIGVGIHFN